MNDPKQKVRAWGFSLWGEVGTFRLAQVPQHHGLSQGRQLHADRLRRDAARRRRCPGDLSRTSSSARNCSWSPTRGRCKASPASIISMPARRTFSTSGCTPTLPGFTQGTTGDVKTKTWAIFGDFTYDFTPQWSAIGRRSLHQRQASCSHHQEELRQWRLSRGSADHPATAWARLLPPCPNFTGSRTDKAFTPRVSVNFKPNPNNNIYLSYSKGFKGGGFDPRGNSTNAPSQSPQDIYDFMAFDPEKVDSYELGWKASLFDRRLQLATAIFDAEYKDVQVPGSDACLTQVGTVFVPGFCGITTNAGKARMRGVEVEDQCSPGERSRDQRRPAVAGRNARLPRWQVQAVHHQHRRPWPDGRCGRPQDPEHAQVDAERHDRLRHSCIRRPAERQHDFVVPQLEPAVRNREPVPRPARVSLCGMPISCGDRLAAAGSWASTART